MLFNLPEDLCLALLIEWLEVKHWVLLDLAVTKRHKEQLQLCFSSFYSQELDLPLNPCIFEWIYQRKIPLCNITLIEEFFDESRLLFSINFKFVTVMIVLQVLVDPSVIIEIINSCSFLERLFVDGLQYVDGVKPAILKQLISVDLELWDPELNTGGLEAMNQYCRSLTVFEARGLHSIDCKVIVANNPRLYHFVSAVPNLPYSELLLCPHLETINITVRNTVAMTQVIGLINSLRCLKFLKIIGEMCLSSFENKAGHIRINLMDWSAHEVRQFFSAISGVHSAFIHGVIDRAVLEGIASSCGTTLTDLVINHLNQQTLSALDIASILEQCPMLTSFSFMSIGCQLYDAFELTRSNAKLNQLQISGCKVSVDVIHSILLNCVGLETLKVSVVDKWDYPAIGQVKQLLLGIAANTVDNSPGELSQNSTRLSIFAEIEVEGRPDTNEVNPVLFFDGKSFKNSDYRFI